MKLKTFFVFSLLFSLAAIPSHAANQVRLINGSNIYSRIFLFFFPAGKHYEAFTTTYRNKFSLELEIPRGDLFNPPALEDSHSRQLITSNLIFTILDIPQAATGEFVLPVSIRCNRKITQKKVKFTVVTKENIMVLSGKISNLRIGELTDDPFFHNRLRWYYPFYFDLRLQLPSEMIKK